MFALGSLLISLAKIVSMLLTIYEYVIIGSVIISWVGADPYNPIVRVLKQLTEPVFSRVRRILPAALLRTGIDFTPMIVLILLVVAENLVTNFLYHYGANLLK